MTTLRSTLFLLLATATLVAGCAGQAPPVRYYALSLSGQPATELAFRPELSIEVGPVSLPEALNREQIVTRSGSNRLTIHDDHRWAAPLDKDLGALVTQELGRIFGSTRISLFGRPAAATPDLRLLLEVQRFDGALGEEAILQASWSLLRQQPKETLATGRQTFRRTPAGPAMDELVAAQSALVRQLSEAIARDIAAARGR